MSGLTFRGLRRANLARLPQYKNANGKLYHLPNITEDSWTANDWMTALVGEVGEAANLLKKIHRGDFTMDFLRAELADELADAVIYLDLLAAKCGISLTHAVASKFNIVSVRVGSSVFIRGDGRVVVDDAEVDE